MKPFPRNPSATDSVPAFGLGTVEATLRTLARLPAPEGLEDRVMGAMSSAPRSARMLEMSAARGLRSGWMRAAAAAAIAFVVAGGGWGVYLRVQPTEPAGAKAVAPAHIGARNGFSSAGAMRMPQTLNGPAAPVTAVQPDAGNKASGSRSRNSQPKTMPAKKKPAVESTRIPAK